MLEILSAYLIYLATVYGVTIALYFAFGGAITLFNRRIPERRIQKNRSGDERAGLEIRKSLTALLMTSICVSFGLFAQARGWTMAALEFSWPSALLMWLISVVIFDAWFYFGHRLMHTKALYRWHNLHHRSVAPTTWSNDSSTMLDTLVMHSYYAIAPFILPIPPIALIAHRLYDQINGMVGHSGFEYFASPTTRWPSPLVCVTFHDQHHSSFRFNYGNFSSIWDRLMGTLHPEYDQIVAKVAEKQPSPANSS